MLEVSLPGVFAYVENKICSNMVGVVIFILSELPCLCSISIRFFFRFFFPIYAHFKTKGIQGA